MSTPAQRLASALRAITSDGKPFEVAEFARNWGIDGRGARRAAEGKDVPPTVYLQLCAALGLRPMTFAPCHPRKIPEIDWQRVGIKISLAFIGTPEQPVPEGFTMRVAAKKWGISLTVLARMKAGNSASTDSLLRLCDALDWDPHDFLTLVPADVSQNHVAEQQQDGVTP